MCDSRDGGQQEQEEAEEEEEEGRALVAMIEGERVAAAWYVAAHERRADGGACLNANGQLPSFAWVACRELLARLRRQGPVYSAAYRARGA